MNLIRYSNPELAPIGNLRRWLQDAFDSFDEFGGRFESPLQLGENTMPADLYEGDEAFQAILELPGFDKKDVRISLENSVLTVQARRVEKEGEGEKSFAASRSLAVPDHIDPAKVSARLENGILTVTLPKAEEKKPKAISIE